MSKSDKAERRAFMFDVRAEQDERGNYIEGRPVVYGKEADIGGIFREEIVPGALDKTDLHDVCFLTNHDLNRIRRCSLRSTRRGLRFEPTSTQKKMPTQGHFIAPSNAATLRE